MRQFHFPVTGNAFFMVNIHYRYPVRILDSLEFRENQVIPGQVAGCTILILSSEGFCVCIVKKFNRRFFKLPEFIHDINFNEVSPSLGRIFWILLYSVSIGAK